MIIIKDLLISNDILQQHFHCHLTACKGACCWEGDSGAPLDADECQTLTQEYSNISPYLTPEGRAAIQQQGSYTWYDHPAEYGTPLIDNRACAYMTTNQEGIAQCGIEQAHRAGATSFLKPISCHLYPIRITKNEDLNFEALNYDQWDICNPACQLGQKEKLPLYQFVKDALIRKYGLDFYEELDAAAQHLSQK